MTFDIKKPSTPLRVTKNRDEIVDIFKDACKERIPVVIWQNINNERLILNATFKNYNIEENTIVLDIKNPQALPLKNRATLYLKGNFKSILFKEMLTFSSGKIAIFNIPKELRLIELRKFERKQFRLTDDKFVEFFRINKLTDKKESFKFHILDLSNRGLAFNAESMEATNFIEKESITITAISDVKLPVPVKGTINYIKGQKQNIKAKQVFHYRLGVVFESIVKVESSI